MSASAPDGASFAPELARDELWKASVGTVILLKGSNNGPDRTAGTAFPGANVAGGDTAFWVVEGTDCSLAVASTL